MSTNNPVTHWMVFATNMMLWIAALTANAIGFVPMYLFVGMVGLALVLPFVFLIGIPAIWLVLGLPSVAAATVVRLMDTGEVPISLPGVLIASSTTAYGWLAAMGWFRMHHPLDDYEILLAPVLLVVEGFSTFKSPAVSAWPLGFVGAVSAAAVIGGAWRRSQQLGVRQQPTS